MEAESVFLSRLPTGWKLGVDTSETSPGVVCCACASLRKLLKEWYSSLCLHSIIGDGARSVGVEASLKGDVGIANTRCLYDKMEKLESGQCCKVYNI